MLIRDPLLFRGYVSSTGPLCRCGSHELQQDRRWRWRCRRGHFARFVTTTTRRTA